MLATGGCGCSSFEQDASSAPRTVSIAMFAHLLIATRPVLSPCLVCDSRINVGFCEAYANPPELRAGDGIRAARSAAPRGGAGRARGSQGAVSSRARAARNRRYREGARILHALARARAVQQKYGER